MGRATRTTRELLEMIKFEHTVFALPFALLGMLLAADGFPPARIVFWIVIAMVAARSAAMTFNRIVDREMDGRNPRTSARALPEGRVSVGQASLFLAIMVAIFVLATYELNSLALELGPVALLLILTYSYSKRFTWLCHLWLGLAIGIAPTAAWVAVRGSLDPLPLWLTGAVAFWIGGFDILYSLADEQFDRAHGICSLPVRFGASTAIWVSRAMHLLSIGFLLAAGIFAGLGIVYFVGVSVITLALAYEQSLVKPGDVSKLNVAFFTVNGFVGIAMFLFALVDWAVRR